VLPPPRHHHRRSRHTPRELFPRRRPGAVQQPRGRTVAARELALHAPRSVGLRESALPIAEDLYETTHENVQLAIIDGLDAVYVERISGRASVHVLTRPGLRRPVPATAVGMVLLAHAPRETQGGSSELAPGPLHPVHHHRSTPVAAKPRGRAASRVCDQRAAGANHLVVGRRTCSGPRGRRGRGDLRCRQRQGTIRGGGCPRSWRRRGHLARAGLKASGPASRATAQFQVAVQARRAPDSRRARRRRWSSVRAAR
jgi:hypothetical protein